jgi:hypothetical protein
MKADHCEEVVDPCHYLDGTVASVHCVRQSPLKRPPHFPSGKPHGFDATCQQQVLTETVGDQAPTLKKWF